MQYMTSLLPAAPPSATVDGAVDGVMLMHSDINPHGTTFSCLHGHGQYEQPSLRHLLQPIRFGYDRRISER